MDRSHSSLAFTGRMLRYGVLLIPLIFLGLFFIYPLASIFELSFLADGVLDLSGFAEIITTHLYRNTLWFTTWQAFVSTLLTVLLAIPCAFVFTRYRFQGKSLLMSLTTLPFVLPTVVVASAFSALLGENGVFNTTWEQLTGSQVELEGTIWIILIVHVFYNFAIAFRMITGFWINQGAKAEEAAQVLGCHGWRLWWDIRLPAIRPAVLASFVLVFIFNFTSFGVVLILGQSRFATVEVEIYLQTIALFDLPVAGALSIVQIVTMIWLMLIYTRLQKRNTSVDLMSTQSITRPAKTYFEKIMVYGTVGIIVAFLMTPLATLVLRSMSVADDTFALEAYTSLFSVTNVPALTIKPIQAVGNSLFFALITTVIAVVLGTITAFLLTTHRKSWVRWLDPLFMLPLATSAVTLGFGFIVAFDSPPLNLRTSPILIPLAHILVATPFVVRSVQPALQNIPYNLVESAQVLGASDMNVLRFVKLPLISRGMIVGAMFAFTISMGEFGASLFIARPEIPPTIPIVIYRLLNHPISGTYEIALAMSVVLMSVCAIGFIVIERLRTVGVGEF